MVDRIDKWDAAQFRRAMVNMANDFSIAFDDRDRSLKIKEAPPIASATASGSNIGTGGSTFTLNLPALGIVKKIYLQKISGDATDTDFRLDSKGTSPEFFDLITSVNNAGTQYMDVFELEYFNTDATFTNQIYMTIYPNSGTNNNYQVKVIVQQASLSWLWE